MDSKKINILKDGNQGKDLKIKIKEGVFARYPIQTHFIDIGEDIDPILQQIKEQYFREGDFLAISEKFITMSEGRLIHKSLLKPKLLAKVIYWTIRFNLGEEAYKKDPGFAIPEKIQAAIYLAGSWRMFLALIVGIPLTFIYKLLGKKKGWFYIIAGNRVSEIDGPYVKAMPPFDEFAKIYPENPDRTSQDIENRLGMPTIIIDGNNINTEILGESKSIDLSNDILRKLLLDNPMGQGSELTPIILVRKQK